MAYRERAEVALIAVFIIVCVVVGVAVVVVMPW